MTTYLVAVSLVVACIQIYLLWRLLHAFDVLRRFEERLGHFGDALSLLTETTETGFDSVGRELERLRALGEVRAELRGVAPSKPVAAPSSAPARQTVAEAVAEALMARADATPAHVLATRDATAPRDTAAPRDPLVRRDAVVTRDAVVRREQPRREELVPTSSSVAGPSVAFVQVAGVEAAGTAQAARSTTNGDAVSSAASARYQPAPPDPAEGEAPGLELSVAASDPVSDVVRLIESAQGRPTPAQLNEAAIRLRLHLAGGTARARQTTRTPAGALRAREERHHGALRS